MHLDCKSQLQRKVSYICVHKRLEQVDTEQLRYQCSLIMASDCNIFWAKTYGCLFKMRIEQMGLAQAFRSVPM
jgi:hypothetical protein